MKKFGRFMIRFALGIVALVLIAGVALFMFLDPIIKNSINVVAPKVLGVSVSVDQIQIRPLRGTVYLENFKIGNPQGYSTNAPLFAVQKVQVGLDVLSVASKAIRIHLISIKDPFIHYETQNGKSNVDALMANLQKGQTATNAPATTAKAETTPKEGEKAQKKVIIEEFSLSGTKVSYQSPITLNKRVVIPIPSFELHDIGKAEGGISAVDATIQVLGSIISHLGDGIAELGKSTFKGAGDALNSAAEGGSKAINSAVKSIKKLF